MKRKEQGKEEDHVKRWIDEVEEDLKIMGKEIGMQWLRTVRNGGKLYWKPKSTTDCSVREEGGGGGGNEKSPEYVAPELAYC
jgi:hypothetical protein